ncbi:hypothetical protein L0657_16555 [Dyadobacter sp. CY345]|nr:hypothetical protein [Dyadobacter sp. CY345]
MGCDQSQEKSTEKKVYYDLKGFIETKISSLSKQKPTVDKTMSVSGKNESRSTRQIDWKKEMELFVQADINKPAYSKSYAISKPDSLTTVYTLKTEENIPVKSVMIRMDKNTGDPVIIKALLRSENKLYQSEKNIELHCGGSRAQWKLTSYSIRGYQKLATMDKKDFDISANVKY